VAQIGGQGVFAAQPAPAVARQRQRCLAAVARRQGQPAAAQFGAQGGFAGGKIKLRRIGHGARSRNENALCE